jgi:hypothetical protein
MQDKAKLAQTLKAELTFLEQGGYRRGPRYPWRPTFIFEDSPTCINYRQGDGERKPCGECPLIDLVPSDRRSRSFPCRHIDLTENGDTVHSFYEYGTEDELEAALGDWLKKAIRELEAEHRAKSQMA